MFELNRVVSPTLESLILIVISIAIIWGGFIWVKKKQQCEKGFFYTLLLSLQIFFWPFVMLGILPDYIPYFEFYVRLLSINPYYPIYHTLFIPIAIHGAYAGVKMLKVTEQTKKGMKINLLLNTFVFIGNPKMFTGYFIGFPYYIGTFLMAAFFFSCYLFVRRLNSDDPNTEPLSAND